MEKDKDFSKLYHILIDSGILARMTKQDIKVYLVLNRYANYNTGIAMPTVMKISRLAGVNKNDVKRTTDKLQKMGLILAHRTGEGFSFRKEYGIVSRTWIEPGVALQVTASKKTKGRIVPRGGNGRFIGVPRNTEHSISQSTVCDVPESAEGQGPKGTDRNIVPKDTEQKEKAIEISNRDIYLEADASGDNSGSGESVSMTKITEVAMRNGFRDAMRLQRDKIRDSGADAFKKQFEEEQRKAKEYFENIGG